MKIKILVIFLLCYALAGNIANFKGLKKEIKALIILNYINGYVDGFKDSNKTLRDSKLQTNIYIQCAKWKIDKEAFELIFDKLNENQ